MGQFRSCTIHENNIQELTIEIFKHGLASEVFTSIFVRKNNSTKLRTKSEFCVPKFNTEYFEKSSIKYLDLVIWNSLPWEIKSIVAFSDKELEKSIRNLKPDCPCRICKNRISSVEFVNP